MSRICRAIPGPSPEISLDEPIGPDGCTLADILPDRFPSPFEVVAAKETEARVRGILEVLPDRERFIVEAYFGFDGEEPMTLQEIGDILGLTRERIRQIMKRSFLRLRTCL